MIEIEYDQIAEEYRTSKTLPHRKYIEEFNLFRIMGDVRGRSVLDLACGEGIYSRKLKFCQASTVTGVDISSEMIELSEVEEKKNPLGISYLTADASSLGKLGEFDVVLGAYLLCYARSRKQLIEMCQSIYRNLRPGGKFVGVTDNPEKSRSYDLLYRKYGFTRVTPAKLQEGEPIQFTFYNPDGTTFSFNNYHLTHESYNVAFREAGFRGFRWIQPIVSEEGNAVMGADYWTEFLKVPPVIFMEAVV